MRNNYNEIHIEDNSYRIFPDIVVGNNEVDTSGKKVAGSTFCCTGVFCFCGFLAGVWLA